MSQQTPNSYTPSNKVDDKDSGAGDAKLLSTTDRPTNVRWLMFTLACGTSWFLYLHRYTWNFIRPQLEAEYGFSNTQLESIFTFFNLSYGIGQIPSGMVSDFFGPHIFLGIIIILWAVVLPLFGIAKGFNSFMGLRFLFGAAQAGAYPSLANVTRNWFPRKNRTFLQGLVASFFGRSGGAMSPIIMATLLMGICGLSWRVALMVMAGAGVLFGFVFLYFYRNSPEEHPRVNQAEIDLIREGEASAPEDQGKLPKLSRPGLINLGIFVFQQALNAGADIIYVSVMGSYFLSRGMSLTSAGILTSLPLWGGALGGIAGGFCNDFLIRITNNRRWSRSAVGFSGKFIACFLMFVAINQTSVTGTAIGLFFVKFFSDWTQPTVWGTCTDIGGRFSATVFSIINTSGTIGGLGLPLVIGLMLDRYSSTEIVNGVSKTVTNFNPMFVMVATMYILCAVCWLFIDCTKRIESEAVA